MSLFGLASVDLLLAAAVIALIIFWLFLLVGTRSWPVARKFQLARVFGVAMVGLIVLLVIRALALVGSWAVLGDPSNAMLTTLIAVALAVLGVFFVRELYQSRHL